jgi:phosphocarrier protein HPr
LTTATLTILNKRGLHARAAAKFVQVAGRFDAYINVSKDGQTVTGISIMGLLMLAAATGDTIEVSIDGNEADQSLAAITELVAEKFGED